MNRHLRTFLKKATAIVAMAAVAAGPVQAVAQETIWRETFDTAAGFTVSSGDFFSDGFGDYLGLTGGTPDFGTGSSPSGIPSFTGTTGSYLVGEDLDGEGAALPITMTWSGIDISSYTGLSFAGDFGASVGGIDGADEFSVAFDIDGSGSFITLIDFDAYGDQSNEGFTLVGGTSPADDLGLALKTFSSSIPGTGSSIDIRLTVSLNSGNEEFAVDNFTLLGTAPASGEPIYWDTNGLTAGIGGSGTWTAGASLFATTTEGTDPAARAAADAVNFSGTAGTVTVSGTVEADAGLTFGVDGYTLAGGTVDLGGPDAATNSINVASDASAEIGSVLSGAAGMTKAGFGTLTLSGANTYSGGTIVSGGALVGSTSSLTGNITNNAAVTFDQASDGTYAGVMDGSGSLTKSGAGNLTLSGANTYSGGTTVSAGTLTGTTTSLQGAITNNAAVVVSQDADGTYSGAMTGSGSLTASGTGNLTLSGANTYSGGTTVSAGTLTGSTTSLQGDITNNAAVVFAQDTSGTYAGAISGTGSLSKSGSGSVTLSGANTYSGGTSVAAGTLAGTTTSLQGDIVNDATVKFSQASDGSYAGVISGTGSVEIAGAGTVTLTAANTFSGGTTVSAGTLVAGDAGALGSGGVTLSGGGLMAADGLTIANSLVADAPSGGFIISEYVEGSSNNKYIELFNGTGAEITLADYRMSLFGNGSSTATQSFLLNAVGAGETLAAGQTIVIANASAALPLPEGVTAHTTAAALTFFNGDDALALQLADGTFVDIFGVVGDDPGSAWTAGESSTVNQTLVRNADVTSGVAVNPSGTGPSGFATLGTEWASYPLDTASNLGSHTMNGGTASAPIGSLTTGASVIFSGSLSLTSDAALTAAAGGTTEFSGVVSGTGGIDKVGAGTVVLSGTNTYSGGTTVSAGTLSVSSDANLGDVAGGITLAGGSVAFTSGFTLGSGRTLTAAASTTSTLDVGTGLTVAFDGAVTGSGNLDKTGAGQLTLGNASTGYTGGFTISAGTVELTAAGAFANATVTQTGGTLLLNPAGGGTDVDVPDFGGEGGEVSVASGKKANFGGDGNRSYRGQIRGQGGLKKSGSGQLTLDQINDYAGATEVTAGILEIASGGALSETSGVSIANGGRLKLNGRVGRDGKAADVTVAAGGILSGAGQVIGTVGGAGGVGPGNSPGILEATATDPSSGLDYAFEFTDLTPDYTDAGASVNDLLRLTDTSSPFSGSSLGASNVIDLYFNDGSFGDGRTYTGGFFLDATSGEFSLFADAIRDATFNVFVADATGGVSYEGNTYLALADYNTANGLGLSVNVGVATIPSAGFTGGTVTNGQAMQVSVVPEPASLLLGGLGLVAAGVVIGRRRRAALRA